MSRKNRDRRKNQRPAPWTPLRRATPIPWTPAQERALLASMIEAGCSEEEARSTMAEVQNEEVWKNDTYQVSKRLIHSTVHGEPPMVHLSIKRIDRKSVTDWRDKQRIKNQLCGEEVEMIELYPAESRLVDTANQFHLWGILDPEYRFPFGWMRRLVMDHVDGDGATQRNLDE